MKDDLLDFSTLFKDVIERKVKNYRKIDCNIDEIIKRMWKEQGTGLDYNRQTKYLGAIASLFEYIRPYKDELQTFLLYGSVISNSTSEISIHTKEGSDIFSIEQSDIDGLILTKNYLNVDLPYLEGVKKIYNLDGKLLDLESFNLFNGVRIMKEKEYLEEIHEKRDLCLMYYSILKYNSAILEDKIGLLRKLRLYIKLDKESEIEGVAKKVFWDRIEELERIKQSLRENGK